MKKTIVLLFSLVLVSWVSAFSQNNPNPSMHFYINNEHHSFSDTGLVKIIQLQYNSATDQAPVDSIYDGHRNTAKSLTHNWPKEFRSSSPVYAPYQKLMFVLQSNSGSWANPPIDTTKQITPGTDTIYSDMFFYTGFHAVYQMEFKDDKILLKDITPGLFRSDYPFSFYRTAIITILIELLGIWLILLILRYPDKKRFVLATLLANIISLPIYLLITLYLPALLGFVIGGVFVVIFEAAIIWFFTKKAGTFGKMILLSFFLNFMSMLASGAFLFLYGIAGEAMNSWFM